MRKHSILMKFFLIFTVTILISSLLSGIVMSGLVRRYLVNAKKDEMLRAANTIEDLWVAYTNSMRNAKNSQNEWISTELRATAEQDQQNLINTLEQYEAFLGNNAYLYVVQPDGVIAFSYPLLPDTSRYAAGRKQLPASVVQNLRYHDGQYYFEKSEQYAMPLKQSTVVQEENDFYGLYTELQVKYLTVSKRITYTHPETKEKQIGGLVLVSVPIPNVVAAQKRVIGYFVTVTVVAVLLELVILFFFTKKLTQPLLDLKDAAARVADGKFDQKIQKSSNDEIGELVDSFNKMEESLANLDQMRNDFIANVSHELRTPMTSIGGFIDGILEGVIPPERQEHYLTIVRGEITRMNTLVNELLDVARLQSGRVQLDFRNEDVNRIAQDCLSKLEPLFREKELLAETHFEHDTEFAWVDHASVDRVFINLIQNAVKFTNSGGKITVHTARTADAVRVIVEDTGKGIPESEQSMIFERFYKVDHSRGLDKKGTGLGLSLVKNILKAHGGDIRVESQVGVGSKFIFTLPMTRPDTPEPQNAEKG